MNDSTSGLVYALEGNVVDRVSSKNGKGWCENVSHTLNTQDRHAVVYAIDQQGGKSNCGYAENVMMTLCSDSHGTPHAVCIALEGNGSRPSHLGKGFSEDGTMYTLNTIEQHSVCYEKAYGISRSCLKGGNGSNGGMPIGENMMPSMTANGTGAVCYAVENHPNDSRVTISSDGICSTLTGRMGTGGNNTPMVLIRKEINETDC